MIPPRDGDTRVCVDWTTVVFPISLMSISPERGICETVGLRDLVDLNVRSSSFL